MSSQGVMKPVQVDTKGKVSVRAAASSFVGTTIEWYDYFLYGTAASLIFPRVFFSDLEPAVATLSSLATFAVAFLLRPVGGVVIGHFGDRLGRKKMLILTLLIMGVCTGFIGLIPPEQTIGIWAPVILIVLRVFQGFALGGEWGGAALMSVEHAPAGRRGLFGATMQMGVPAGLLLSTGAFAVVSVMPDEAFFSWGWRIPFLASFILLGIGMYIRLAVTEPDAFKKVQEAGHIAKLPIREVLANDKRRTLNLVFLQSAANVGYFLITVYSLVYVTETLHLPRTWAVTGVLMGAAVDLLMQPVFGWLSDRIGRKKVYGAGSLFLGLYAFPFFWLLESASEPLVWLALVLGLGIGHASTGSLHAVIYAEQYPARYRYTGSSLAYQLSGIISSAPTPLVAAWLVSTTGQSKLVAVYVIIAAAVSVTCTFLLKETYKSRIDL